MTTRCRGDARALASELGATLTERTPGSPLTQVPAAGNGAIQPLRRLVVMEYQTHAAELQAYGTLLARFPHRPAAELWLTLGRIVDDATPKLRRVADALGMDATDLMRRQTDPYAYSFNSAMSRAVASGSQTVAALAAHTDMRVYYAGATAVARRLREARAPVPAEFLDYYDDPGDDALNELALDVAQDGLDRGDDPQEASFHMHRIAAAILEVWRIAAAEAA
ncbi:hypothetical protein [Streptomyces sp. NPDC017988]|uniref:hypothetical protein n=1 Tax=Streptomyces sp. NPDC017988 TaxID=3365025 RepID=UPI00379A610F